MTWATLVDVVAVAALAGGAILCLTSAIGLLRLPDLYSRMHAATKPQALGLLLMLLGLGLTLRSSLDVGMLLFVAVFQLMTIPVSAHLVARARYRDDHGDDDHVDDHHGDEDHGDDHGDDDHSDDHSVDSPAEH